jgi:hyperosmotically inducible protein
MKTSPITLLALAIAAAVAAAGCNKLPAPTATTTAPAPEAPVAVGNIADVDVTEHVNMALLQSELLKGARITVGTTKGDVRLSGTVTSQAQADEAVRIARLSAGVHAVHNEIVIAQ